MGLPFVVLNMVSVLMFKGLGIGDAQIALWTSLIMMPWTLKFLWSPFLEMFKTKKFFVVLPHRNFPDISLRDICRIRHGGHL